MQPLHPSVLPSYSHWMRNHRDRLRKKEDDEIEEEEDEREMNHPLTPTGRREGIGGREGAGGQTSSTIFFLQRTLTITPRIRNR